MFDFLRVAAAVPQVRVADIEHNTQAILEKLSAADGLGADVVVFPELAVTGYTCADLFNQQALITGALGALGRIVEASLKTEALVIVGAPLRIGGQLYNCAVFIGGGQILGVTPKTFLPNYNEYYEKRWFSSSTDLDVSSVCARKLGMAEDYDIPVGRDIALDINGQYTIAA